jgi:acetyl-CoA acetyltransferase
MERVLIVGVGMTPFTRDPDAGLRKLATSAAFEAVADAGVPPADIRKIFFGNAVAATVSHQDMIRGQVAFRNTEFAKHPILNIENACASGGTALHLGWEAVAAGRAEVVLVVGAEQLSHRDKSRTFTALRGSTDIEEIGEDSEAGGAKNSILMDYYAAEAISYLSRHDATVADFARVAVKNRRHASANELAHYRTPQTVEDVLSSRTIAAPLTLPMCSPTTDGAAALLLCSAGYARRLGKSSPEIVACEIAPGTGRGSTPVGDAAAASFELAGIGPEDLDLVELHDAAAPAELMQYVELGLCREGEAHHLLRRGETELGGRIPVNTSGGLMSRGHPLGATGCAQVIELYLQLQARAGSRQVPGASIGLAANAGGWLDGAYAVAVATILKKH